MSNPNKLETQRSKLSNGQRPKGPDGFLKSLANNLENPIVSGNAKYQNSLKR
jgi:hypothetical protein